MGCDRNRNIFYWSMLVLFSALQSDRGRDEAVNKHIRVVSDSTSTRVLKLADANAGY